MNGLTNMNEYKEEWMMNSSLLHPHVKVSTRSDGSINLSIDVELVSASKKTARAVASGVALASMDGPLPIMDVVGFGVAVTGAALAWYDYFK